MTTQALGAPRRRRRPAAPRPSASIIPITRRPRLQPGDYVELIGDVLPQNRGAIAIVTSLNDDGWVSIESCSGLLAYRDRSSGELHAGGTLTCCVQPHNLYRLDRYTLQGVRHV
jgi:hypothetical protein